MLRQRFANQQVLQMDGRATFALTPVTEQPMMRPCRRTPRYHFGPILLSLTSSKPAAENHCMNKLYQQPCSTVRSAVLCCSTCSPTLRCVRCSMNLSMKSVKAQIDLGWVRRYGVWCSKTGSGKGRSICYQGEGGLSRTSRYSCSVGNSIQASAKKLDSQKVGCTGPIMHANPPFFSTRYASLHGAPP